MLITLIVCISAVYMCNHAAQEKCPQSLGGSAMAMPSICSKLFTLNPVRLEALLPRISTRGHQRINGSTVFRKKFKTSVRIIS